MATAIGISNCIEQTSISIHRFLDAVISNKIIANAQQKAMNIAPFIAVRKIISFVLRGASLPIV